MEEKEGLKGRGWREGGGSRKTRKNRGKGRVEGSSGGGILKFNSIVEAESLRSEKRGDSARLTTHPKELRSLQRSGSLKG